MKIKERFQKDSNALLNIAGAYADQGYDAKAKKFFRKAIQCSPQKPDAYLLYGSYLLEVIRKRKIGHFGLSSEDMEQLAESEQSLSKVIDALMDTDRRVELEQAYVNRSSARIILDNFPHAMEDLNAALQINPTSSNAYANRARLKQLSQDKDNAIIDFKLAIDNGADRDNIIPLLVLCFLERPDEKPDEAIEAIKEYYSEEETNSGDIVPRTLLAECYIVKKNYEEAGQILEKLYAEFGRDPKILLIEADLRKAKGNIQSFEDLTTEAHESAKGCEKDMAGIQLANHYKRTGAFDKAIPLYKPFVSDGLFDEFVRDYLICLYESRENRARNIQKCLTICEDLRRRNKGIPFVMELAASIYRALHRLEEARNLYSELSKLEPTVYRHSLNYAATLLNMGREKEAEGAKVILAVKDQISDKENLIMLAGCLLRIHDNEEAMKQAYKALELDSEDPEIQALYVQIFLNWGDKKNELLDSDSVKEDFYVKFKKDGKQREHLIVDRPAADMTKFEIQKDSGLGRALYGKKIGEKIKIGEETGVLETIEILDIKSKYVKAFQTILDDFNTSFPDNKTIQKFEADPNKINSMLKQRSERASIITQLYQSKRLTIGALASLMNRNLFITWGALIAKNLQLYCASGSGNEQTRERESILKSEGVLLEPVSLFTLAYLDLLSLPGKYFKEVFIAQASVDEITRALLEEEQFGGRGYTTLFFHEGKPYKEQISAEGIKKKIDFLGRIKDYVGDHIQMIGVENPLEDALKSQEDMFGTAYVYSIQNCKERHLALFSDDLIFREIVSREYGTEGFCVQNFLLAATERGLLDEKLYFEKIIALAKLKYHYLSISAKMLFYCAEKTLFHTVWSEDFRAIARILEAEETSVDSLIAVLSDFMKLILIELPHGGIRRDYLDFTLKMLTLKGDPKSIVRTFDAALSNKLGLANYLMKGVRKEITSWLKANYRII